MSRGSAVLVLSQLSKLFMSVCCKIPGNFKVGNFPWGLTWIYREQSRNLQNCSLALTGNQMYSFIYLLLSFDREAFTVHRVCTWMTQPVCPWEERAHTKPQINKLRWCSKTSANTFDTPGIKPDIKRRHHLRWTKKCTCVEYYSMHCILRSVWSMTSRLIWTGSMQFHRHLPSYMSI